MLKVFIGWDRRESAAYRVCLRSLLEVSSLALDARPLVQDHLRALGLYRRPETRRGGQAWDAISRAPVSTEFALTRFLVPHLAGHGGWALFCDADFLWRADPAALVERAEPDKAIMVVQHDHRPRQSRKMDGQRQETYPRKNWSSLVLWNCAHPAHRALTLEGINGWPGRALHGFAWLDDDSIGALPEAWNWLAGWSPQSLEPAAVHFTDGTPDMPGCADAPYAKEWRAALARADAPAVRETA